LARHIAEPFYFNSKTIKIKYTKPKVVLEITIKNMIAIARVLLEAICLF